ncbi:MAG: hypothetical protein KC420_02270 [Myxococcales bacterium]|nr:hypothetical protein [Myxococcales bacterium]MCB9702166.1 hypothetical protein [Myxococcales bacterium]
MKEWARILTAALVVVVVSGCGKDDDASASGGSTGASATTTSGGSASDASGTSGSTGTDAGSGSGSDGSTGGVDVAAFERFLISSAAGPCAPGADCDGFVELLAGGTLRVERFGETESDIVVVQIAADDYDAAVQVFAAPELSALLDAPEPLCDPPTDIFESMLVVVDGVTHDATTTTCGQAPIAAARSMAQALQDEYAP